MESKDLAKGGCLFSKGRSRGRRNGIRVASFFSGGGGLDFGFDSAGFQIVFASDLDSVSCETLAVNSSRGEHSRPQICCGDIREIALNQLPKHIDLVIGGPPCQSYSASGRRAGGAAGTLDQRGTLFEAYIRVIRHLRPKAFLFENVRGIFATNGGNDWSTIAKAFLGLGYKLSFRILDACDYGVPQHRERVILVGHQLDGDFLFPRPTHGPNSLEKQAYVTPRRAFQSLEQTEDLDELKLGGGKYSELLPLVPPGGNYLYFTAKRGYPSPIFAYRSRFSDFLYKASPDEPTKTIIASPGKYTGPFHWDNRSFSIAEYKALQGFPQDYKFAGNRTEIVRQIGNSVSPLIAHQLALAIQSQIFRIGTPTEVLPVEEILSFDKRKGQTAQKTRDRHARIAAEPQTQGSSKFSTLSYQTSVLPPNPQRTENVVTERIDEQRSCVSVYADQKENLAVSMSLLIGGQPTLFPDQSDNFRLDVKLYGTCEQGIQTMWNAVDDWVIRSSSFHSLFELYGHFTEPHPIFSIESFRIHSPKPIFKFAQHISTFTNCSQYFPRTHLTSMFGNTFGTESFTDLVEILRGFRFDIRCHETNVAISQDVYMVCYPFTLPFRRQMNFSVKPMVPPSMKQSLRVSL